MTPWYDGYWPQWVIQNILPTIACAAAAAVLGVIYRKRILAWWHRIVGERADLEDMRAAAAAAHRIAADLWEHHCGRPHPDAPKRRT